MVRSVVVVASVLVPGCLLDDLIEDLNAPNDAASGLHMGHIEFGLSRYGGAAPGRQRLGFCEDLDEDLDAPDLDDPAPSRFG